MKQNLLENLVFGIPELYYRIFGNEIVKNFKSVSIIQSKETIDEWFDFNLQVKNFKDE